MSDLIIAGVAIRGDAKGRVSLNDLHQASGLPKKKPGNWTRLDSTKELIAELDSQSSDMSIAIQQGGEEPGTYAVELLAISYAGWLSPAFQLKVNQAFLDSHTAPDAVTTIKDDKTRMMVQTLIRMDRVEQELETQKTLTAEAKDIALQALLGQQWLSIRQYVLINELHRQFPVKDQNLYGRWLAGYCLEKGLPFEKARFERFDENKYWIQSIKDTLPGWLRRKVAQLPITSQATS